MKPENLNNKKKYNIEIRKSKDKIFRGDLVWEPEERIGLEKRILALRDDQIASLPYVVGIAFSINDIENIVKDIKENGHQSGHLSILTDEAKSKELLLWWLDYFEKHK